MKAIALASQLLRRRPLAAAVAASLALHGGALAGVHFLLQGDGPDLLAVRHVGFVVIERAPPASGPSAAVAAPADKPLAKPVVEPAPARPAATPAASAAQMERAAARDGRSVAAKPITPVPAAAQAPRAAGESLALFTPPHRPDAPIRHRPPDSSSAAATNSVQAGQTDAPRAPAAATEQQAALGGGETSPPAWGVPGQANPAPSYPWLSRQRGEQGRVVLRVSVDAEGRAVDVNVAASSGFGRLDRAAEAAIRRWRFAPARRAGVAVPGRVEVPVTFRLSDG